MFSVRVCLESVWRLGIFGSIAPVETSFGSLTELAKELVEISEEAKSLARITRKPQPLDGVVKQVKQTTSTSYKFD